MELVPKELIFVGRSMRIIQANNQVLGSPVNRLNILARHAADALISPSTPTFWRALFPRSQTGTGASAGPGAASRLTEWLVDRIEFVRFRSTLLVLDAAFIASTFSYWLRFLIRSPLKAITGGRDEESRGFEDDLEKSMRKMA